MDAAVAAPPHRGRFPPPLLRASGGGVTGVPSRRRQHWPGGSLWSRPVLDAPASARPTSSRARPRSVRRDGRRIGAGGGTGDKRDPLCLAASPFPVASSGRGGLKSPLLLCGYGRAPHPELSPQVRGRRAPLCEAGCRGGGAQFAPTPPQSPSPLGGEGGRRPDEGASRFLSAAQGPLTPALSPRGDDGRRRMRGPAACSAAAQGPLTPTLSPEGRGRRGVERPGGEREKGRRTPRRGEGAGGIERLDGCCMSPSPLREKVAEGRMREPAVCSAGA